MNVSPLAAAVVSTKGVHSCLRWTPAPQLIHGSGDHRASAGYFHAGQEAASSGQTPPSLKTAQRGAEPSEKLWASVPPQTSAGAPAAPPLTAERTARGER